MAYRYYSTLRPLMVGGIPFPKQPGESITTIVNFEEGRTYCKDIDRPAWGYIEYTAPLDPQQVSDYELVRALTPKGGDGTKARAIISRLREVSTVITMAWADYRAGGDRRNA